MKKLILLSLALVIFSCNENTQKTQEHSEIIKKEIKQHISDKNVLIVRVIKKSEYSKFTDFWGNNIQPGQYYYWYNGHLFRKEFAHSPSLGETESDFLLKYQYIDIPIGVRSNQKILSVPLKMRVFNTSLNPKIMKVK